MSLCRNLHTSEFGDYRERLSESIACRSFSWEAEEGDKGDDPRSPKRHAANHYAQVGIHVLQK